MKNEFAYIERMLSAMDEDVEAVYEKITGDEYIQLMENE